MHLAADREDDHEGPVGGNDRFAEREREGQEHRSSERAREEQQRERRQRSRGRARPKSDSRRRAGRRSRASMSPCRLREREFGAAAHQKRRSDRCQDERRRLHRRRPAARQPQAPGGEGEARDIAEQGRIAELGHVDPDVPGGEIGGEEEACEGNDASPSAAARPVHRLSSQSRDARTGTAGRAKSRQKPAATGPTPASRTSQGPKRERAASDQKRRKGERMMARTVALVALRPSEAPRKPELAGQTYKADL